MFDYENFNKQSFKDKMESFMFLKGKHNLFQFSILCVPKSSCLHDIFLISYTKGTTLFIHCTNWLKKGWKNIIYIKINILIL